VVEILRCPRCDGRLGEAGQRFVCRSCSQVYPVTDGIAQLFVPNDWADGKLDVTNIVKDFYEDTPFPNYDDMDSRETLRKKARLGVFARILDERIPPNALVLDAGSGTASSRTFRDGLASPGDRRGRLHEFASSSRGTFATASGSSMPDFSR
jgi:hypothetical protein